MSSLNKKTVAVVVNRFIGVDKGYLGDFTYRSHHDFYPEYCDLDYDPYPLTGTTRETFIEILSGAPPADQAKILWGVIERFPVDAPNAPHTRTEALRSRIASWAESLLSGVVVESPTLDGASDVVARALNDAEVLLKDGDSSAVSAVDRVHTAFHGYLEIVCREAGITVVGDESITSIFKKARKSHPKLQPDGPRADEISRILNSSSAIVDALNSLRNRASIAHPNKELLGNVEATLLINIVRSLLHFINEKVNERES